MRWFILLTLAACATDSDTDTDVDTGESPVEGLGLTDGGATITIDDTWRACSEASDCVLVDVSCDGCCGQDAISAARESEWSSAFQTMCADYEGGVCDCEFQDAEAVCVNDRCDINFLE